MKRNGESVTMAITLHVCGRSFGESSMNHTLKTGKSIPVPGQRIFRSLAAVLLCFAVYELRGRNVCSSTTAACTRLRDDG